MKAVVEKSGCISCSACVGVCPVTAITMDENNKAGVDPNICIGCSVCVGVCPVSTISMQ